MNEKINLAHYPGHINKHSINVSVIKININCNVFQNVRGDVFLLNCLDHVFFLFFFFFFFAVGSQAICCCLSLVSEFNHLSHILAQTSPQMEKDLECPVSFSVVSFWPWVGDLAFVPPLNRHPCCLSLCLSPCLHAAGMTLLYIKSECARSPVLPPQNSLAAHLQPGDKILHSVLWPANFEMAASHWQDSLSGSYPGSLLPGDLFTCCPLVPRMHLP